MVHSTMGQVELPTYLFKLLVFQLLLERPSSGTCCPKCLVPYSPTPTLLSTDLFLAQNMVCEALRSRALVVFLLQQLLEIHYPNGFTAFYPDPSGRWFHISNAIGVLHKISSNEAQLYISLPAKVMQRGQPIHTHPSHRYDLQQKGTNSQWINHTGSMSPFLGVINRERILMFKNFQRGGIRVLPSGDFAKTEAHSSLR